jgi:hypothetical protein
MRSREILMHGDQSLRTVGSCVDPEAASPETGASGATIGASLAGPGEGAVRFARLGGS